jgi:hypothetical protein
MLNSGVQGHEIGRQLTVCDHPKIEEINRRLLHGKTYRTIANDTGLSETALKRHKNGEGQKPSHIPTTLARAQAAGEIAQADRLLDEMLKIQSKTFELLDRAEESNAISSWPGFLRELREQVKLMAELEGRLAAQPQINVLINPQWIELRALIIAALEPYPDAREAVVNAIR